MTTFSYLSNMGDVDESGGGFLSENTLLRLPKARATLRPKTGFTTLPSTGESEKFFLITLQQFVQEVSLCAAFLVLFFVFFFSHC